MPQWRPGALEELPVTTLKLVSVPHSVTTHFVVAHGYDACADATLCGRLDWDDDGSTLMDRDGYAPFCDTCNAGPPEQALMRRYAER